MARDHARVNLGKWGDPKWRQLTPAAQHLYGMLWESPSLSYCGVHDWRPARLTGLSRGWTKDHLETVAQSLEAQYFLVIDRDTEEVLIRSWIQWDGLMKQPRMAISCVSAYAEVASERIRNVLVCEIQKYRKQNPNISCWKDKRVQEVLSHKSVSAKDLPVPEDPFGVRVGGGFDPGLALGLPQTGDGFGGGFAPPVLLAPAPAPISSTPKDTATASRGHRIPSDFDVTEEMREWANAKGWGHLDLQALTEEFYDYWSSLPGSKGVKLDWVKTWKNRVREVAGRQQRFAPKTVDVDPMWKGVL